ncbi:MAG: hypothetical protein Q6358_15405 [Candidatus Brocadiales bacterium]|nr:hypothetical protein [Candidatus Brocadiales bacterium]
MYLREKDIELLKDLRPGIRTNKVLYYLLETKVLGYWSFLEPKHKGIELADTLVWWKDVVLLFEAKTREKPEKASDAWIRTQLNEAVVQVNEKAKMLRNGGVAELRNKWRGVVKWDPVDVKNYYGIIVLNCFSDSCDPREIATEAFKTSGIPIQVFSIFDLAELLRFINTIWDFIIYYELRGMYSRRYKVPLHEEFQTYKGILNYWEELLPEDAQEDQVKDEQEFQVAISNAILRSKLADERGYSLLAAGCLLDLAMGSLKRRADPDKTGKIVGSQRHEQFVSSIGAIAELSRRRRSIYGRKWVEAAKQSAESGKYTNKISYCPIRNRSYIFCSFASTEHPRDIIMSNLAQDAMKEHKTTSCLCLGAASNTILSTFETLLSWAKGKGDSELPDEEILDTSAFYGEKLVKHVRLGFA